LVFRMIHGARTTYYQWAKVFGLPGYILHIESDRD